MADRLSMDDLGEFYPEVMEKPVRRKNYPHLYLDNSQLAIDPSPGEMMDILFRVKVVSISTDESLTGGPRRSFTLELQKAKVKGKIVGGEDPISELDQAFDQEGADGYEGGKVDGGETQVGDGSGIGSTGGRSESTI